MAEPSRGWKVGSILMALLIGGGIILLAGSIMMPSTKRARVGTERWKQMMAEEEADRAAATQAAATGSGWRDGGDDAYHRPGRCAVTRSLRLHGHRLAHPLGGHQLPRTVS